MSNKLVQKLIIRLKVLLLLLLVLVIDTGWGSPVPGDWDCDITNMHKKKSMPGHCYSYQQCQWKGIGDYDMEIMNCPPGRIFDENISECVTDKVLAFNFDKSRCDNEKPLQKSSAKRPSQPPQKPNFSPLSSFSNAKKEREKNEGNLPYQQSQPRPKSKPLTMDELKRFSEQSFPKFESSKPLEMKSKISEDPQVTVDPVRLSTVAPDQKSLNAAEGPIPVETGKENSPVVQPIARPSPEKVLNEPSPAIPPKKPFGRSMSLDESVPSVEPVHDNPNPFDVQPIRPRIRVPEVTLIKEPDFFKPFNNFPPATKSQRTKLYHEPFVKPYYFAAKHRVGVWPKWD